MTSVSACHDSGGCGVGGQLGLGTDYPGMNIHLKGLESGLPLLGSIGLVFMTDLTRVLLPPHVLVKDIVCSNKTSIVLTETGDLWAFGSMEQVGVADSGYFSEPTQIEMPEPISEIAGWALSFLAMAKSGSVYCFGKGVAAGVKEGITGPKERNLARAFRDSNEDILQIHQMASGETHAVFLMDVVPKADVVPSSTGAGSDIPE